MTRRDEHLHKPCNVRPSTYTSSTSTHTSSTAHQRSMRNGGQKEPSRHLETANGPGPVTLRRPPWQPLAAATVRRPGTSKRQGSLKGVQHTRSQPGAPIAKSNFATHAQSVTRSLSASDPPGALASEPHREVKHPLA
jgi:hypothetical protein